MKSNADKRFENAFGAVKGSLEYEVEYTRNIIKDFKEDELKLNALETEGYLRGILFALACIEDRESEIESYEEDL